MLKCVAAFLARLMAGVLLCCLWGPATASTVPEVLRARLEGMQSAPPPMSLEVRSLPHAVAAFYADRGFAPAWDEARFTLLLKSLDDLSGDGLNPADYGLAHLRALAAATAPEAIAERDLDATRACLLALLHLYRGKVDPVSLDTHWNFPPRKIDPAEALHEVELAVRENRIEELFDRARPVWGYYDRLRIALSQLRKTEASGGWPVLPAGPTLKPGMIDTRVPLLRRRLQLAGLLPDGKGGTPAPAHPAIPATKSVVPVRNLSITATVTVGEGSPMTAEPYDESLRTAVQRFQGEANLEPDGNIGRATLAELNVPVSARINQVRANLERVRWFKSELGKEDVIVDLAGYRIIYVRDGVIRWSSRVQVGREFRPSPVFQATITYLTLSPAWVVPPTIFQEDSLPAIRKSRSYLTKNKLHVYTAAGVQIPESAVNWGSPGNIQLRQEPGADGALGELAIRFDNPYSVYLHDTPHKELFSASKRATSSGCIRVENVHELAVLLLDDPVNWSREKLQEAIDTRETRKVRLSRGVPILLGYWTVQVDPDGYVSFRPDIYHRDEPLLQALDAGA